ncbi:GntR family transcriptional regulator [Streptomyces calidiresistens]|uniref:UTRA domain-containing protein n=1 Tax=Streptomyces calidiresistens TaxID=1485586 RepID=A0A7W3T1W8_9ACTN|nr:GntR family transcriptional regulator [Streptomyces calidiresistens]MBB0229383.1 UTRA domain-containing protein [Streptomyces calidiresistens]
MADTYLELADRLARVAQEMAPGQQFATVPEIARNYEVHRNTASRAIQHLKERGVLTGKKGGKTWVRVPPIRAVRRNTRYQVEKDLALKSEEERRGNGVSELDSGVSLSEIHEDTFEHSVVDCPAHVADFFGFPEGTKVLRRKRVRRHRQGGGSGTSVSYIPYDLASRNPELFDESREPWPGGTMHQLHTLGVEVARIDDHITASMPTDEEMELQDIPQGVPVIRVTKVSISTNGRVVEVTEIPLPADRSQLIYSTHLELW